LPLSRSELCSSDEVWLLKVLFFKCFMPYAKKYWVYGSALPKKGDKKIIVNCEDLSEAFLRSCKWVGILRRDIYHEDITVSLSLKGSEKGFVTRNSYKLFAPDPNYGNVRSPMGNLTGKCYFGSHTVCKIGSYLFDPTFGSIYLNFKDLAEREVLSILERKPGSSWDARISEDKAFLYIRKPAVCGPFADSWYEVKSQDALSYNGIMPFLKPSEQIPADVWKGIAPTLPHTA